MTTQRVRPWRVTASGFDRSVGETSWFLSTYGEDIPLAAIEPGALNRNVPRELLRRADVDVPGCFHQQIRAAAMDTSNLLKIGKLPVETGSNMNSEALQHGNIDGRPRRTR